MNTIAEKTNQEIWAYLETKNGVQVQKAGELGIVIKDPKGPDNEGKVYLFGDSRFLNNVKRCQAFKNAYPGFEF